MIPIGFFAACRGRQDADQALVRELPDGDEPQPRPQGLQEVVVDLLQARIGRAAHAHRKLMYGSRQRPTLLDTPRDIRVRQPENKAAEIDQEFVECPVNCCK
ncbi:MAG TPA: hypothetical protein VKP68_13555, partial [Ramlibacter sp.]|nr:hypothetical protein [Ramlibacter sp.]